MQMWLTAFEKGIKSSGDLEILTIYFLSNPILPGENKTPSFPQPRESWEDSDWVVWDWGARQPPRLELYACVGRGCLWGLPIVWSLGEGTQKKVAVQETCRVELYEIGVWPLFLNTAIPDDRICGHSPKSHQSIHTSVLRIPDQGEGGKEGSQALMQDRGIQESCCLGVGRPGRPFFHLLPPGAGRHGACEMPSLGTL